ncbi:MAG: 3-hydroxyacyl-CoA dehydrogenase NAD-binding domain-containing protein [Mariprofundaceae bacterium]
MEILNLTREEGRATLHFERRDRPVNILDLSCMELLEAALDKLEKDPPKVLVFESGMPGCFIAGADVDAIAAVKESADALRLAERGQAVCRRIEDLPSVSIAVVNGACLGGGLEIALACDHILAVRGSKTRLGLPEIKLGIHPGFGGCVRLPKRTGWMAAVDMILTGKQVDADKARRLGLAGLNCFPEKITDGILHLAARGKPGRSELKPFWLRIWPARALFFRQVRKRAMTRFSHLDIDDAYPAISAVIDLLSEMIGMSDGLAYAREAESISRLAVTPTCKNLIRVFKLGEALKHQEAVKKGRKSTSDIQHVSVYGAGVMGSGIGWVAAKNRDVDLHDVSAEALGRGLKNISHFARRDPDRMRRIRPVMDGTGLGRSQVVIEAVLEDMTVKKALWEEVEARVGKEALLLSNTSSLSISEMQGRIKYPGRVAGLHFFNPAPKMPLVEVVAGDKTTRKTIQSICALAVSWGKYPVVVADRPGFLVNRCLMPYMVSALQLLEQGQSPERVDGVLKHFGMPMGAFELADRVGLDICRHVGAQLDNAYASHESMPDWLAAMVKAGLLGEKSGSGFFRYEKGKRGQINPDLSRYIKRIADTDPSGIDANIGSQNDPMTDVEIENVCILPMLVEALLCLKEGIVDNAGHLDAAFIYGIGFPPFKGGILAYYATLDRPDLICRLEARGLVVPDNLEVLDA